MKNAIKTRTNDKLREGLNKYKDEKGKDMNKKSMKK